MELVGLRPPKATLKRRQSDVKATLRRRPESPPEKGSLRAPLELSTLISSLKNKESAAGSELSFLDFGPRKMKRLLSQGEPLGTGQDGAGGRLMLPLDGLLRESAPNPPPRRARSARL